ncbi:MAG: RNA polymerase sigma factor [Deltaproteobacteria bacterium]|nr:RNA polymerase sigma factor [Deltaproteobacteria bacterium]
MSEKKATASSRPAIGQEEALMEAYVKGDREAFRKLFRLLAPRVHGFFLRKLGNPAVADDLMQITFLKVHRARNDYRIGAPLRPWLFTIAARVRLDELRRRVRKPEDADPDGLDRASDAADVRKSAMEVDIVERKDIAAKVREALAALPESQRVVVQLHRYEEFTFDEIAKMIGSTEGAVKLRAFRAYEKLRAQLAPLVASH